MRVLVTGATGYVGSRLVPELLAAGHEVFAAVRHLGREGDFPWGGEVTPRVFDIEDPGLVRSAVTGMEAVVYLVHSMESDNFVAKDREAAKRVAAACEAAGVDRLVYLSGLVPDEKLSDHLRSRLEVEKVFLASAVPTTSLRAAMVVGSGSTSFEILRRLTQRVPLAPIPTWMRRDLQPIAVEDVVHLVSGALSGPARNRAYDVGGDDVLTYPELLATVARVMDLRRPQLVVPWAPPAVVGRIVAALTQMDRMTVMSLVESLSHDMVCTEDDARRELADPGHRFVPLVEALSRSQGDQGDQGTESGDDVQAGASTDQT